MDDRNRKGKIVLIMLYALSGLAAVAAAYPDMQTVWLTLALYFGFAALILSLVISY